MQIICCFKWAIFRRFYPKENGEERITDLKYKTDLDFSS